MKRKCLINLKDYILHKICFYFLIIFLIGCDLKFSGNQDMVFEEIGKAIRKRNFKDNLLVELGRFEYDQKAFLIQTFENRLLLINNQQNQVLMLDENLNPTDQKIKAGEGPSEHVGVKRLFFFDDLSYLTFDHSQQLIRVFNKADSLISFYKIKQGEWIHDIVHLEQDKFLTSLSGDDYFSFVVFNSSQNVFTDAYQIDDLLKRVLSENELEDLPLDKNLVFEGYFSGGREGKVVYSCNKTGILFLFDQKGAPLATMRTIDQLPVPKLAKHEISPGYLVHGLEPDLRGNYSRGINQQYIFILSNLLLPSYDNKRPVDVYDHLSEKYIFSFFLPNLEDGQMPDEITVDKNQLYVLYENGTIVKYLMKSVSS
jgi:hypothetical protein